MKSLAVSLLVLLMAPFAYAGKGSGFQILSHTEASKPYFQRTGLRVYGDTLEECDNKIKKIQQLQDIYLYLPNDDRRNFTNKEADVFSGAGTIIRKGNRKVDYSSGMVINSNVENRDFDIIVASAHSFYNSDCSLKEGSFEFRPMGDKASAVKIEPNNIHLENPCNPQEEGEKFNFNNDKVAIMIPKRIKLKGRPVRGIGFAMLSGEQAKQYQDSGVIEPMLVGLNYSTKKMNVSDKCEVFPPQGSSASKYNVIVTNCDCVNGCSGGGLIAKHTNGDYYLIGVFKGDKVDSSAVDTENINKQTDMVEFDKDNQFNFATEITKPFVDMFKKLIEEQVARQNTI